MYIKAIEICKVLSNTFRKYMFIPLVYTVPVYFRDCHMSQCKSMFHPSILHKCSMPLLKLLLPKLFPLWVGHLQNYSICEGIWSEQIFYSFQAPGMPGIYGIMYLSRFGSPGNNELISDAVRQCACEPV